MVGVMLKNSDEGYTPVSRSPRGRGRGRGSGRGSTATPRHKEHVTVEDVQLQSDDDIVTINSVKLGKRFNCLPVCLTITITTGICIAPLRVLDRSDLQAKKLRVEYNIEWKVSKVI